MLKVTREPFSDTSSNEKKRLKAVQGTQASLIKQMLLDISLFFVKNLSLLV